MARALQLARAMGLEEGSMGVGGGPDQNAAASPVAKGGARLLGLRPSGGPGTEVSRMWSFPL